MKTGKKIIVKEKPGVVEGEIIPQPEGGNEVAKQAKEELKARDELGQRSATYHRYKNGVDYDKIGTEEYKETIGNIVAYRGARGHLMSQATFKSGAELLGAIDAYWDFLMKCANDGKTIVPDVEGLASFLGVSRATILRWGKGEVNPEFGPIVEQAFNDIAAAKKQMGLHGKIPTIMLAMDFNNNHGYVNQQNTKVDVSVSQREPMKADQLLQMAALLPKPGDK